jgi:hypothetical protein
MKITRSEIGTIDFLSQDRKTCVIRGWSKSVMEKCGVFDNPMHFPVKGAVLWAQAIRERKPLIVNDYAVPHPAKRDYPQGHVELSHILSVPVSMAIKADRELPRFPLVMSTPSGEPKVVLPDFVLGVNCIIIKPMICKSLVQVVAGSSVSGPAGAVPLEKGGFRGVSGVARRNPPAPLPKGRVLLAGPGLGAVLAEGRGTAFQRRRISRWVNTF